MYERLPDCRLVIEIRSRTPSHLLGTAVAKSARPRVIAIHDLAFEAADYNARDSFFEQYVVAVFGTTEGQFCAPALGNVVRHSSDDRGGNSLGAKRVVVLPDAGFSSARQNYHKTFLRPGHFDSGQVFVKQVPILGRDQFPHRSLQQFGWLIPQ